VAGLHAASDGSAKSRSHWKTTIFVVGLSSTALTAPCVIDGPMNDNAFLAYVEQVLAPTLKPGDVIVLDNLSVHKVPGIREAVEAAGARLLICHPIRRTSIQSSSSSQNSKSRYKKAAERSVEGLSTASCLLDAFHG
jgi:hypothetical protein